MANYTSCPNCGNSSQGTVYKCSDCKTIYCSSCKGFTMFHGPACPRCNSKRYGSLGKIKR